MIAKQRFFLKLGLFILLALASVEVSCEVAYRVLKGTWYFKARRASAKGMIQVHPYFAACLVPNVSQERNGIKISHNSFRCRGTEFARPKPAGLVRVVALGGSSTYCTGVSDNETWECFLSQQLGTNHEVINMGAPGGTSIETMSQTALLFSDVQPDIALYYLGWNDAQVQHVQDLWPDWSDSHGQFTVSLARGSRDLEERTAAGYFVKRMIFHWFFPRLDPDTVLRQMKGSPDALTDRIDQRALGLYERNLHNIVTLCKKQGVEAVLIPQILNYDLLTSDKPYGWIPFVRDRDLKKVMGAYNETMAKVAQEEGVPFVSGVLAEKFEPSDFVDNGHFSKEGNRRFAAALASCLNRLGKPGA